MALKSKPLWLQNFPSSAAIAARTISRSIRSIPIHCRSAPRPATRSDTIVAVIGGLTNRYASTHSTLSRISPTTSLTIHPRIPRRFAVRLRLYFDKLFLVRLAMTRD